MRIFRAIIVLTCVVFLGACGASRQAGPRQPTGFKAHAGPAPPDESGASYAETAQQGSGGLAPAVEGEASTAQESTTERSVDITGKSNTKDSSKKGKTPPLPSLEGKLRTGLLGLPSTAQTAQQSASFDKERQRIVLNFEKADIAEVTSQIFGDYLKVNYVLDPTLQGRISLYLEGEYNREEMLQMITKAYEANNVSVVPRNGIYYLQPVQRSSSSSLPVADSLMLKADKDGVRPVIVMYRLRYMDVKQAINTIKFFLAPGRPITADSMTNSVIFVDDTDNAQSIVSVLQALDINILQEVSMEIVPLKSISPQDAAQSMEALIGKLDFFKDSTIKGNVAFIPLQNFGGVLVLARNSEIIKTAKYWLSALDVEGAESGEQIHVYFVQNGLAVDIGNILNQVFGLGGGGAARPEQKIVGSTSSGFGSTSRPFGTSSGSFGGGSTMGGSSGGLSRGGSFGGSSFGSSSSSKSGFGSSAKGQSTTGGALGSSGGRARTSIHGAIGADGASGLTGEVIIIPDEVNNAIVVRANALDYGKIKKTIETLDILPRAVLIEVMIAEITLNKDFQYGIQWFLRNGGTKAAFNRSGSDDNTLPFRDIAVAGSGLGLLFKNGEDFAALIRLLSSRTDVNILATPTLLATDNKEASIQVGGREPVPTGSISGSETGGTSVISTIEYEETGTILNVTPHINAGGLVRLEVEQTTRRTLQDSVDVGNQNTAPRFDERNIKTTILAQNGSTIVIGGIIDQTTTQSRDGIPFLQDVPIISPLFSAKNRRLRKTELIIAITPHVVNHRESGVTREFLDKLQQLRGRIEQ